jgi:hypothetical protein
VQRLAAEEIAYLARISGKNLGEVRKPLRPLYEPRLRRRIYPCSPLSRPIAGWSPADGPVTAVAGPLVRLPTSTEPDRSAHPSGSYEAATSRTKVNRRAANLCLQYLAFSPG